MNGQRMRDLHKAESNLIYARDTLERRKQALTRFERALEVERAVFVEKDNTLTGPDFIVRVERAILRAPVEQAKAMVQDAKDAITQAEANVVSAELSVSVATKRLEQG